METPRLSAGLASWTTFAVTLRALSSQFSCDLLTIAGALQTFCSRLSAEIGVIFFRESWPFNELRGDLFPTATPEDGRVGAPFSLGEKVTARNARSDTGWAQGLGRPCDDTDEDLSRRKTLIRRFAPPSPRGRRAIAPPFREPAWQSVPVVAFEWRGAGVTGRIRTSSKTFEFNNDNGIVVGKTESGKLLSAPGPSLLPARRRAA
jgi:hypothetical protein